MQYSPPVSSPGIERPAGLDNYFLPLPNRNMFSFILLNAFAFILAIPLIIINTDLLTEGIARSVIIAVVILALLVPLCISCVRLVLYYLRLRPTDHEYDTWVRNHESLFLQKGLQQLHLDQSEIIEKPLCIRGIVWPNSKEAEFYLNNGYPMIKWDRYGTPHASINRFVFFYPTQSTVDMFTSDLNALSEASYSRAQKYFYKEIVGFEIVDLTAHGYPSNVLRQFEIHITGGQSIGIPISPSDPNAMDIVKMLNALLREHQNV